MKKTLLLSLLGSTLLVYAGSPSFNCHKATTTVEKRICQSSYLSGLDREMYGVYKKVKDILPKGDQKRWIKERNACITSSDFDHCLASSYLKRIDELHMRGQAYSGSQKPATSGGTNCQVAYQCNTFELDTLTATFHEGNTPSVSLSFEYKSKPVRQRLSISHSGSGAKYQGKGISFWEHHGEATLLYHGHTFVCKEIRD